MCSIGVEDRHINSFHFNCNFKTCSYASLEPRGQIYKISYDNAKAADGRLIYKMSYEECEAFLRHDLLSKS